MSIARMRAKLRRIRDEYEEEETGAGELNLVPYLDIITNVVMFLLATVTFSAALAQIPVNAPKLGDDSAEAPDSGQPALRLAVAVKPDGFTVTGDDKLLDPDLGGKRIQKTTAGEYDFAALTRLLSKVKDAHPKEESILVALDLALSYDLMVRTFDAARADGKRILFPNPAVGVGE